MKRLQQLLLVAVLVLATAACNNNTDYLVTIHTPYGDMKAVLYDETPQHKENFIRLARAGKYDSTIFHRVINNFMIQGGDLNLNKPKDEQEELYTIPAEFVPKYYHVKGALAAARQGDQINPKKESSGTQFYIVQGIVYESEEDLTIDQAKLNQCINKLLQDSTHVDLRDSLQQVYLKCRQSGNFDEYEDAVKALIPLVKEEVSTDIYIEKKISPERIASYTSVGGVPHLDDEYTVFGRVVEGLDVIDKIAAVRTSRDKPLENVHMTIDVEEVPIKEMTKRYGIQYNR